MSRSFFAKCRRVFPRNFAEKTLGEISDILFSPRKSFFRARGVPRRNAKKELFFLGLSVFSFSAMSSEFVIRSVTMISSPASVYLKLLSLR